VKRKIIGVSGSLRENSRTTQALEIALAAADQAGAEVEMINLRELGLPFYDDREDATTYPSSVSAWLAKVSSAHGIILATPVYHGTLSGALKNALDFITSDGWLRGKLTGLISVAGGIPGINAINSMLFTCQALESMTIPLAVAVPGYAFDLQEQLTDLKIQARLKTLGQQMVTTPCTLS
jgi:NAD(P)H-dependent FMN reductase